MRRLRWHLFRLRVMGLRGYVYFEFDRLTGRYHTAEEIARAERDGRRPNLKRDVEMAGD